MASDPTIPPSVPRDVGLCESCQNIRLEDLPMLSDGWEGFRTEDGMDAPKIIFQPSLDALSASANACVICRFVLEHVHYYDNLTCHPDERYFDTLCISRTAELGEGLVISQVSLWRGKTQYRPVLTIDISVHDDGPLSRMFPGRPLQQENRREDVLKRASAWLSSCKEHPNCRFDTPLLPTRVLNVGKDPALNQIVLEIPCDKRAEYIALSHRWGTASSPPTTTTATLQERTTMITLASLPVTFQDAVVVTRSLGFQYLWIDSLCIIQDDPRDWEIESSNMASVYSQASLTLAARGANDTSFTFFGSPSQAYVQFPYKSQTGAQDNLLLSLRERSHALEGSSHWYHLEEDPLSSRGWAFQERVLSPRMLYFGKDGMVFECSNVTRSERGYSTDRHYINAMALKRNFAVDNRDRDILYQFWRTVMESYSECSLTKPSDALPALSGVADMFAELSGDKYMAGLWLSDIEHENGLLWHCPHLSEQPLSFLQTKPKLPTRKFPSWSWLSAPSPVFSPFSLVGTKLAQLVDHAVVHKGANPYGEVESAWLRFRAPFIKATRVSSGPSFSNTINVSAGPESDTSVYWDDHYYHYFDEVFQSYSSLKLFALVLSTARQSEGIEGLIVTPCEQHDENDTYGITVQRLGMFKIRHGWQVRGELDLETKVLVTLV